MRTREEILVWMSEDRSPSRGRGYACYLISGKAPLATEDLEFCGLETESILSCFCGFFPVRKVAFEGVNTGRRFICCMCEDEDACDFLMWYDLEWPAPMQRSLHALWLKNQESEELLADKKLLEKKLAALLEGKLKAENSKMEMELMMADKLHEMEGLMAKLQGVEEKEKKSQLKMLSKMKKMKMELNKKDLFIWVLVGSNVALFSVLGVFVALKM